MSEKKKISKKNKKTVDGPAVIRTEEEIKRLSHRLSRIEGQVRGINQMLENGRSYEDLTVQMLSVINALKGLSNYLVREHLTKNVLPSLSEKELEECMYALNWLDKIK